jgi:dephospho-CoA kinase
LPFDLQVRPLRIALTGGIATGKSHVRAVLERLGVPTIDADTLAREAVAPGSPGLAAVVARFGREFLDSSGALDRRALGDVVFRDAGARRDLEAIVHPHVRRAMDAWFESRDPSSHPLAVADIPLLYETGREGEFDKVIVTACRPESQIHRLMARDSLTEAEARHRVRAQLPLEDKVRRADFVIRTDGTYDETEADVQRVVAVLLGADL